MTNLNVETWNQMYAEGRSLLRWPDENVVSYLNQHKNSFKNGIDIACGAGRHTFLMAEMGIDATGVDSSEAGINYANVKVKNENIKNIRFYKALAQDLQLEGESFDLVIMWGLIHYLEEKDQKAVLEEVYRILKPKGTLLCTMRSIEDTRASYGKETEKNRYLVDYFDGDTQSPKQTLMYFWDESGVRTFLERFSDISLGHRSIEPIGKYGNKSSHWLIAAMK